MDAIKLEKLTVELKERLCKETVNEVLRPTIWCEKEAEEIYVAPSRDGLGRLFCVEEVALFVKFYNLSVSTYDYETGAGLRIFE